MNEAITKAMEAVRRASEALPVGAWDAQAQLLAAYDALATARRGVQPKEAP
jgi:hypothetical protein